MNETLTKLGNVTVEKPVFNEMRKCSFNPLEHLSLYQNADGSQFVYLDVAWRIVWFNIYCEENGLKHALDEGAVEVVPLGGNAFYIQSKATAQIEGELPNTGVGGKLVLPGDPNPYAVQQAATIAKGRALANAGFGTAFNASTAENGGNEIPCDGGVKIGDIPADFFIKSRGNSADDQAVTENRSNPDPSAQPVEPSRKSGRKAKVKDQLESPIPAPVPSAAPIPFPEFAPQPPQAKTMSFEEARDFVVNINHEYKGKTLGEVYALGYSGQRTIEYFAEKSRKADLKAAAAAFLAGIPR